MPGPSDPQDGDEAVEKPPAGHRYPHPRNCYRTAYGTWYVQLSVEGERIYLGTFLTVEKAVTARDEYRGWLSSNHYGRSSSWRPSQMA
jgi:hypothetical protein